MHNHRPWAVSSAGRAPRSQRGRRVAFLSPLKFAVAKPPSSKYPKKLSTVGDHIRARRLNLGLSQIKVAELIGVTNDTIMMWELNRTIPAEQYKNEIVRFLGYFPLCKKYPFRLRSRVEKVKRITQHKMIEASRE